MKKSKKFKGIDWSNLKFALVVLAAAYVYEIILKRVNNSTGGGSQLRNGVCLSVGIVSASLNVQQRASIRQGWGRSRDICRRRFFIATNKDWTVVQKVQQEVDHFKDIVLVPIEESYYNITYQTLEIFKTLSVDPLVTHVMKVDDDSYIRTKLLHTFLKENKERYKEKDTFMGYLEPISGPIRDINSKWYMGQADWPYDYYPTWAHGAGYILSANLARNIGNGAAALSMQGKILHLEDVSTGIWINYVKESLQKHVEMIHNTRFNFFPTCLDQDFVTHYASPELQECLISKRKCSECMPI